MCCCAPPDIPNGQTGWSRAGERCREQPPDQGWPCRFGGLYTTVYKKSRPISGGEQRGPGACSECITTFCFLHVHTLPALVHCCRAGVAQRLLQLQTEASARGGRLSGSEPRSGAVRCRCSGWPHAVVGQDQSQCACHDLGVVRAFWEKPWLVIVSLWCARLCCS